jgi:hypothetical protein
MKSVIVIVGVVLLAAGAASGGAGARVGPATSVAFAQCQAGAPPVACRSIIEHAAVTLGEGDLAGDYSTTDAGDVGMTATPDHSFVEHMVNVAYELAKAVLNELMRHYAGGGFDPPPAAIVAGDLFDPHR